MNKIYKQPWVDALRSGKYEQTTGELVRKGNDGVVKYCCLGVLQLVCKGMGCGIGEDEEAWLLDVREAKQLLDISEDVQNTLSKMNDGGASFEAIADHIEATL